jgi:hypothetical protein
LLFALATLCSDAIGNPLAARGQIPVGTDNLVRHEDSSSGAITARLKVSGCATGAQGRDHASGRLRPVPDLALPDDVTVHVDMWTPGSVDDQQHSRLPPTYQWFVASC